MHLYFKNGFYGILNKDKIQNQQDEAAEDLWQRYSEALLVAWNVPVERGEEKHS